LARDDKENPKRLEEDKTFAGQSFQVGWIVAKAYRCSFMRERGSTQSPDRFYKDLTTNETFVSINHLIRLDRPVKLTTDTTPKSKQKRSECIEGAL